MNSLRFWGSQMAESYENLSGAEGRQKFYRPIRRGADEVFPGATPIIWLGDHSFELRDISANGIGAKSVEFDLDIEKISGADLSNLRLMQRGKEIFRGKARATRVSQMKGGATVGISLDSGSFDISALAKANAKAYVLSQVEAGSVQSVPKQYKEFCSDVHAFIGGYLRRLSKAVAPIEVAFSQEDKAEVFHGLYDDIKEPWSDLIRQGNNIVIPYHDDREAREKLKHYTESVITRDLVKGATWQRSYNKPLGYPGDYALMNYMYDEQPVGDTLESLFMHSLGLVAGRPIVARMFTLGDILLRESAKRGASPFRVTSIGCGPSRELENIFSRAPKDGCWEFTLVDQEPLALEYSINSGRNLTRSHNVSISGLNMSFTEMLSPAAGMTNTPAQDIFYSLGLVDYLSLSLAKKFVKRLYSAVAPGGKVIIANVNNLSTGITWQAEHVTDWTLYFRSRDEMLAMAQGVPDAKIEIAEDSIRSVYFLIVTKPVA